MKIRLTLPGLVALPAATLVLGFMASARTQTAPVAPQAKPAQSQTRITPADAKEHEATGFPLVGNHLQLTCEACHEGKEAPKPACQSCHKSPHGARLKRKCEDCHTAGMDFGQVKFRHPNKDLWAFHKTDVCRTCHPDLAFVKASGDCTSCHADFHKGSVGLDCYACHRQPAWNVTRFDHNGTGFPLMGAHRALECGDCHRDLQSFKIIPRPNSCASCHQGAWMNSPFPHARYGAGLDCQECHLQDKWEYAHSPFWYNVQTGPMAGIACSSCHKNAANYMEYTCHDCHAGHAGDRNGRCVDCHTGAFPIKEPKR